MAKSNTGGSTAERITKMSAEQLKVVEDFLKSDKNFQSAGFGSQLILQGFKGKLIEIALTPVAGANTTERRANQGPQKINGITVAEVGEASVTLSLVFEGGKTISLSTLTQHKDSKIAGQKCADMVGADWNKLVGKTLTCDASDTDPDTTITRVRADVNDPDKTVRENVNARKYAFSVAA
jgi:hypothetical protein